MHQTESLLAEICENARGTTAYLDMQAMLEAGRGKKLIGLVYQADGPNRADLITQRMRKELEKRLYGLLSPHQILIQLSVSNPSPVLLKEWAALTDVIADYCPQPRKWLAVMTDNEDRSLADSLKIAFILWIEFPESVN